MNTLKILKRSLSFHILGCTVVALLTLPANATVLLNGVAIHSELGTEKFIAGLYSSTLTSSSKEFFSSSGNKKIELRVLDERLSARRFKRMWIEGMAINSSSTELEAQAHNMAAFSNMLKVRLIRNDIFAVEKTPEVVKILVNDIVLGEIDDPHFFDVLLRTWIGFVPLSSEFRDNLLKQGSVNPDLLARFEQIQPKPERVAVLQEAISNKQADDARQAEVIAAANVNNPSQPSPKPRIALPPGKIKLALAAPAVVQPAVAQTRSESASAQKPEPAPVKKKPVELPKPEPVKIALPPQQEALDESIFEEGEGEIEFTAEGLLIEQLYYSRLANYTQNFARYPRVARERGREGSLLLRVTIDREGQVVNTEVIEETESYSLNKEAARAVKRASPFPPMPEEIPGEEFSFTFRLTFSLASRSDSKDKGLASR